MLSRMALRSALNRLLASASFSLPSITQLNEGSKSTGTCTCMSQRDQTTFKSSRFISTSFVLRKRRKGSPEAAVIAEQKAMKKPRASVVPIWKNMTVQDLANSLEKSLGK